MTQTYLVIRWYNRNTLSMKKYKELTHSNNCRVGITTILERGDWLILDKNEIRKYSEIEDKNQPQEPGYEIYDMYLITNA